MSRSLFSFCVFLPLLTILVGCEYVRPTLNAPLKQWDPDSGYRWRSLAPPEEGNSDSLFIVASFSGGGTRASTLSFGALREMARQPITWEGKQKRLLDELDLINALSGGTFTGAYYALFGDQIFHDFEYVCQIIDSALQNGFAARAGQPKEWFGIAGIFFF